MRCGMKLMFFWRTLNSLICSDKSIFVAFFVKPLQDSAKLEQNHQACLSDMSRNSLSYAKISGFSSISKMVVAQVSDTYFYAKQFYAKTIRYCLYYTSIVTCFISTFFTETHSALEESNNTIFTPPV